jgi:S-methylmethionine-dependent homocysteine/selenocysteine methylase
MVVNMDLVNNLYILDGGLATEIERRGHTILVSINKHKMPLRISII